jgi:hypothetical protein
MYRYPPKLLVVVYTTALALITVCLVSIPQCPQDSECGYDVIIVVGLRLGNGPHERHLYMKTYIIDRTMQNASKVPGRKWDWLWQTSKYYQSKILK